MSSDNDQELAKLFAEQSSATSEQEFVQRVNTKLTRSRRMVIAIRVLLVVAALVAAAPFVPSLINSVLSTLGLPTP
jgi:hypothetical protein